MHIYFTMDLLTIHHANIPSPSSESMTLSFLYPATAAVWARKKWQMHNINAELGMTPTLDQSLLSQMMQY